MCVIPTCESFTRIIPEMLHKNTDSSAPFQVSDYVDLKGGPEICIFIYLQ